MFEVYVVGNDSQHFIISSPSVHGKADIHIWVAIPIAYETWTAMALTSLPVRVCLSMWAMPR